MHEQSDGFDEVTCERSVTTSADASRGSHRFVATVAHELRQPLGAMVAAVELMKRRVSPGQRRRARLVLERQLRQLSRLVEDLVDATGIREGKAHLRCDRVDLRAIVSDAIDDVEAVLRSKHQAIRFVAPHAEAWVSVDIQRIQQVVANLLANASKFSAAGSCITVTVRCEGADVRLVVQDHGRGIPADALPYIFDMFRQATDGEDGGLGIGLTVVRGLVELHGGTVDAHSAGAGLGSTFTVHLPALISNRGAA